MELEWVRVGKGSSPTHTQLARFQQGPVEGVYCYQMTVVYISAKPLIKDIPNTEIRTRLEVSKHQN